MRVSLPLSKLEERLRNSGISIIMAGEYIDITDGVKTKMITHKIKYKPGDQVYFYESPNNKVKQGVIMDRDDLFFSSFSDPNNETYSVSGRHDGEGRYYPMVSENLISDNLDYINYIALETIGLIAKSNVASIEIQIQALSLNKRI